MVFGDRVQATAEASSTNASSLGVTLGSAPTSGNLLVATIAIDDGLVVNSQPTGFVSQVVRDESICSTELISKVSDGTESGTLTFGWPASNGCVLFVTEYEGPYVNLTADATGSDLEGDNASTTAESGVSSTTTQADELAVAAWTAQRGSRFNGSPTLDNSYTLDAELSAGSGAQDPGLATGHLVLTATGTTNCTATYFANATRSTGVVATFKKDVADGITPAEILAMLNDTQPKTPQIVAVGV